MEVRYRHLITTVCCNTRLRREGCSGGCNHLKPTSAEYYTHSFVVLWMANDSGFLSSEKETVCYRVKSLGVLPEGQTEEVVGVLEEACLF